MAYVLRSNRWELLQLRVPIFPELDGLQRVSYMLMLCEQSVSMV